MSQEKHIDATKGQHLYIDLPDGGYVMVDLTKKGVEVSVFNIEEETVSECSASYKELCAEVSSVPHP